MNRRRKLPRAKKKIPRRLRLPLYVRQELEKQQAWFDAEQAFVGHTRGWCGEQSDRSA